MVSRKAGKKRDSSIDESNPRADILLDTTARLTDDTKTWKHVYEILEHENLLCLDDSVEEYDDTFSAKLGHVAKSELHKFVAQSKLMPYTDMISCALEHVDIPTRSIVSHQKTSFGYFQPEDIQVMYKLSSKPKYTYNSSFILKFEEEECIKYDRTNYDIIKTWWGNPTKFKYDANGIYSTTSLDAHIMYISMMLCRIFGKKNPTQFTIEWVPIIHEVVEGFTFD